MPSRSQFPKHRDKNRPKITAEDDENAFFAEAPFVPSYMPLHHRVPNGQGPGPSLPSNKSPELAYHLPLPLKNGYYYYPYLPAEDGINESPIRQYQNNVLHRLSSVNRLPAGLSMGPCGHLFSISAAHPSSSQNSVRPQMASGGLSDVEKLRKFKEAILSGQHPFFTADPNPDALARLYLGPHPASQAYKDWPSLQQQLISKGPVEESSIKETSYKSPSTDLKLVSEETAVTTVNPANVSEALSASGHQDIQNGSLERNAQDIQPATMPSGSELSVLIGSLQQNGLSGATSPASIQGESMSVDKPQTTMQDSKSSQAYEDSHIDSPSQDLDNERDRERPGYTPSEHPPRSDSYRYSQHLDRRSYGRYHPRYPEGRYDRDRVWVRERDREKGRSVDRPHDFNARAPERRSSVSASVSSFSSNVETKNSEVLEGRNLRSEVPPHPEQRPIPDDVIPRFGQRSMSEAQAQYHPGLRRSEPHPPSGPRQPILSRQHPEQRQVSSPYSDQHQRREDPPFSELKRPPYTLSQYNGRRAPLPYTDLHPPHSDLGALDAEVTRLPSHPLRPEPVRPATSAPDHPPASRVHEPQKPTDQSISPRFHTESVPRDSHRSQPSTSGVQTATEGPDKHFGSNTPLLEGRPVLPVSNTRPANLEPKTSMLTAADEPQRQGSVSAHQTSSMSQPSGGVSAPRPSFSARPVEARQSVHMPESSLQSGPSVDGRKYSFKRSPSPHHRPMESTSAPVRDQRSTALSSVREGPALQPKGYLDNRRPFDPGPPRRPPPPHHYPAPHTGPPLHTGPPPHSGPSSQSIIERRDIGRREEPRQWRERSENYSPFDSEVEPDRGGRRFIDTHGLPRGRPPPPAAPSGPASWDRSKDKGYDPWMKYPPRGSPPPLGSGSIPPRWEEPSLVHAPPPPPSHRPLQARLGDTYDQRFIPRDAVDRSRYRPLSPPTDVPARDTYRDNPRLRPRSPSPVNRPALGGIYDDGHRPAKRVRDEYDMPPPSRSGAYYDEGRRVGEGDSYAGGRIPPPPPYYDHRPSVGPRDPPYPRDRVPDPYIRRDVPPSRSPPFYPPRERYPPPR